MKDNQLPFQMLDSYRGDALIIAATNYQGLLDHALWRRFDGIVYFDKPDAVAIESLLVASLRQIGVSPAISLQQLAERLIGLSHADIERIANDAIRETVLLNCPMVGPKYWRRPFAGSWPERRLPPGNPFQ